MNKRNHNIFFHLHTVSGIVISVVLYVIFFAGSFSFFRDEIINWERNESITNKDEITLNFDSAIDSLKSDHNLFGRDFTINKPFNERRVNVSLQGSKDSLATDENKTSKFFYLDPITLKTYNYIESYTLGEFLYRLHFLAQIQYPIGYYLAGFIALFFLFAIITGVLIHWKKIISNFYIFRSKEKLKTLWTDAHTALGMIGLPFQFVYAVTGSFFMIKLLLVAPSIAVIYNGDQSKLYEDLEYSDPSYSFENKKQKDPISINDFINQTKKNWEDFHIKSVQIFNYGDANMHILVEGETNYKNKLIGIGKITYKAYTGEIVSSKNPTTTTTYLDGVKKILYRLHYGDYGGYALRVISFILGIITCVVIISGVMIWLVARDKKNIPEKKKRFNERVVRVYLAICLSMFPITALTFIAVKIFNPAGQSFIYSFYFIGWLLLAIFFILKKDNYLTNKHTLLLGSIIGFLIPITNGLITGNWIWKSFVENNHQILFVDVFWIFISLTTLYISIKLKRKKT